MQRESMKLAVRYGAAKQQLRQLTTPATGSDTTTTTTSADSATDCRLSALDIQQRGPSPVEEGIADVDYGDEGEPTEPEVVFDGGQTMEAEGVLPRSTSGSLLRVTSLEDMPRQVDSSTAADVGYPLTDPGLNDEDDLEDECCNAITNSLLPLSLPTAAGDTLQEIESRSRIPVGEEPDVELTVVKLVGLGECATYDPQSENIDHLADASAERDLQMNETGSRCEAAATLELARKSHSTARSVTDVATDDIASVSFIAVNYSSASETSTHRSDGEGRDGIDVRDTGVDAAASLYPRQSDNVEELSGSAVFTGGVSTDDDPSLRSRLIEEAPVVDAATVGNRPTSSEHRVSVAFNNGEPTDLELSVDAAGEPDESDDAQGDSQPPAKHSDDPDDADAGVQDQSGSNDDEEDSDNEALELFSASAAADNIMDGPDYASWNSECDVTTTWSRVLCEISLTFICFLLVVGVCVAFEGHYELMLVKARLAIGRCGSSFNPDLRHFGTPPA